MPPGQDRETIRKLSQQTDNLLAVVSLLQSQFEAVKKDVQSIKTNVAKLGQVGEEREYGESRKQILRTIVPHVVTTEADTSWVYPFTDHTGGNLTQLRVVHPDWAVEQLIQRETQLGTQLVESGSSFIFRASYDQKEETSDRKTTSRMDGGPSSIQNSVVQSQNVESVRSDKGRHRGVGKKGMKQELNAKPTSRQECAVCNNSATSKFKTENVFDELINLKNEFQEWRVANALIPAEMRLGMRNLAFAQKEQEQKVDELRRFLNLQTQTFVDQQKLILDEMQSLSQKHTSLSDDFRRLDQEMATNQGWNDQAELIGEMYQQNEDICEIMKFVGKQIRDLKVRVKEQCSWRCDTCMATSPVGKDHSQKLHSANTVSHITGSSADEREDEEHDPVIGLPKSVDLTTGDEGEEVVFMERAKLYRYDSNTKDWKECGAGDIKILKDPGTGRAKILMSTDKVHKVCTYQWLTSNMKLLPGRSPDHSWVWRAVGIGEGNVSQEQFAVKFKNPELAAKFKNNFDEMKIQCKGNSAERAKPVKTNSAEHILRRDRFSTGHKFDAPNSVKSINSSGSYGLRQKIGWGQGEVDLEDVLDDIDSGSEEYQSEKEGKGDSSHQRKCSVHEDRPPCPGCIGCDDEDLKAKKEGGKPVSVKQKSSSLFPDKTKDTSNKPFQFAGAGAPVSGSTQQEDDNVVEDQEYDPHYDPIISLPENVDLKTGDEGQEVVFKERAKLYRYDNDTKAWKERGVGDMKILKNPETGRARILMRREQVLKVCANHWLSPNMELLPMSSSDRAWVWNAVDFSDGKECHEQFALKFKTPDLAAEFKKAFDQMKEEGGASFQARLEPVKEKPPEPAEEKVAALREDDSEHKFHQADVVVSHPEEGEDGEDEGDYNKYEEEDGYDDEDYYDEEDDEDDDEYDDEEEEEEEEEDYAGGKYSAEPSLSEMFKPAARSWTCDTCMVTNLADKVQCLACSTLKPGAPQPPQGTSDSQRAPVGMGLPGGGFTLGTFKFSGFSSNPSAFTAGSSFGGSGFKTTSDNISFGTTPSQSSNATPSSRAGFSLLAGGFSFSQPKTETTQPSASGGFKMPALSFSFTAPKPPSSESTKSAADSTTKEPPASKPAEAASQQTAPTSKFNFSSGMSQFTFDGANQQKPSSGFSFGSLSGSSAPASLASSKPPSTSQSGSVFGTTQTTPVIGATSEKGTTSAFRGFEFGTKPSEPKSEQKEAVSFADLVKNQGEFSFRLNVDSVASSPPKSGAKSRVKSPGLNKSGEYYQEEERDDIYFKPVVTLPENYKLETGEENEEIKFSQRAKLYRFDAEGSQWKERGVGDIKVLHNPETNQHRIVMRREQVLKVCANHYITQHVKLQPNKGSERSWVWQAMDSSDGDPQNEKLAVRFKTEDAAREFKGVVDKAKKNLQGTSEKLSDSADSAEGEKETS